MTHHEPRCPDCGRFDADCKCDWPMPTPPPYPADDEADTQPQVEAATTLEDQLRDRGMLDA